VTRILKHRKECAMHTMLKFACPYCNWRLWAKTEDAGRSYVCPKCEGKVPVPTQSAIEPVAMPVIAHEIIPDAQTNRPAAGTTPMELTLPLGVGSMKANVSQGTANTIANTFLGGLLVAMGVVLMAMFGGKPRSA
jgi:uncharacterized protein YlaI